VTGKSLRKHYKQR